MPRPLTRAQALENQAFLEVLERTGNIRLAAREARLSYGTMQHRRAHWPVFAQQCDAALAVAHAKLHEAGGRKPPSAAARSRGAPAYRTKGGEGVVVRRRDGKLQLRAAHPDKLTRQCEQAFLAALSATANVRLSAAAAGADQGAFYRRKRRNPGFAREMRLALQEGYERLEQELLHGFLVESYQDDAWRHNERPPIPPMTPEQAIQLLYLHQKEARLLAEPDYIKRRRGESHEACCFRLGAMHAARLQRDRELWEIADADRRAAEQPKGGGPKPVPLPPLDQVTGWSKADPSKVPHHPERALFGGWRLGDMDARAGRHGARPGGRRG